MNEIRLTGFPSGETVYACIRNNSGQIWYPTNEEFEDVGEFSRTNNDYAITMTDKLGGLYLADFPDDISASKYTTIIFHQLGASPANSDNEIGGEPIEWTGTAEAAEAVDESTATSICNRALLKLGGGQEQQTITSIYEGSKTANICLILYPQVRNEVLQRWPFNEGREFADLGAELSGIEMADWDFAFNLPSNCLAVVAQIDEDGRTIKFEYEIRRGRLFTNDYSNTDNDSAYIDYILMESDTSKYSPALKEAIATKLAAELAPVMKKGQLAFDLLQQFEQLVLPTAKTLNQNEQYSKDVGGASWLDSRTA